jgi:hypothetical protein
VEEEFSRLTFFQLDVYLERAELELNELLLHR